MIETIIRHIFFYKYSKYIVTSSSMSLKHDILYVERKLDIEKDYCILKDSEHQNVLKIIDVFREAIKNHYFKEKMPKFYKNKERFFLLKLKDFLVDNSDKMDFCGEKMYTPCPHESYLTRFQLTDFAISFYKVLFIVENYYKSTLKQKKANNYAICIQDTKNIIDKGWTY